MNLHNISYILKKNSDEIPIFNKVICNSILLLHILKHNIYTLKFSNVQCFRINGVISDVTKTRGVQNLANLPKKR